jgi:cell cycle checkpoint protein
MIIVNFTKKKLDDEYESAMDKFEAFLARAGTYRSVFSATSKSSASGAHGILLLEDLPNILHSGTRDRFHTAIERHLASPSSLPIVVIVSDTGVRGETDEPSTSSARWNRSDDAVNSRSVVPPNLGAAYTTEISFVSLISPFYCLLF